MGSPAAFPVGDSRPFAWQRSGIGCWLGSPRSGTSLCASCWPNSRTAAQKRESSRSRSTARWAGSPLGADDPLLGGPYGTMHGSGRTVRARTSYVSQQRVGQDHAACDEIKHQQRTSDLRGVSARCRKHANRDEGRHCYASHNLRSTYLFAGDCTEQIHVAMLRQGNGEPRCAA